LDTNVAGAGGNDYDEITMEAPKGLACDPSKKPDLQAFAKTVHGSGAIGFRLVMVEVCAKKTAATIDKYILPNTYHTYFVSPNKS
jgi:hypothetical protein